MLTVRLPIELDQRLRRLAKETDRTKAFYVRKALEATLDEFELKYLGEGEQIAARLEEEQARLYALAEAQRAASQAVISKATAATPKPKVSAPKPKALEKEKHADPAPASATPADPAEKNTAEESTVGQASLFDVLGF